MLRSEREKRARRRNILLREGYEWNKLAKERKRVPACNFFLPFLVFSLFSLMFAFFVCRTRRTRTRLTMRPVTEMRVERRKKMQLSFGADESF